MKVAIKELAMEFSVELATLVNLEMEHPPFDHPANETNSEGSLSTCFQISERL
jgi:hypothetical protein